MAWWGFCLAFFMTAYYGFCFLFEESEKHVKFYLCYLVLSIFLSCCGYFLYGEIYVCKEHFLLELTILLSGAGIARTTNNRTKLKEFLSLNISLTLLVLAAGFATCCDNIIKNCIYFVGTHLLFLPIAVIFKHAYSQREIPVQTLAGFYFTGIFLLLESFSNFRELGFATDWLRGINLLFWAITIVNWYEHIMKTPNPKEG